MGAGMHGGFGHTEGSRSAPRFTRVQYEGTVRVNGEIRNVSRRVYQRNDIDFDYYDPNSKKTNLQLMQSGRAPIGKDGQPVQLHHILQKESGPLVEIHDATHDKYYRILHGLGIYGASFRRNYVLDRQYENFRKQYWRWRARQYRKGSK